jgi:hypothetical protein
MGRPLERKYEAISPSPSGGIKQQFGLEENCLFLKKLGILIIVILEFSTINPGLFFHLHTNN